MIAMVTKVRNLNAYYIEIIFKDGHESVVDFEPLLKNVIPLGFKKKYRQHRRSAEVFLAQYPAPLKHLPPQLKNQPASIIKTKNLYS